MKRGLLIAGALLLLVAGGLFATPQGRLIYDAIFTDPATYPWDGKQAYARCPSAIAGRSAWPEAKAAACAAMDMCVNDGGLSWTEQSRLEEMMHARGCGDS